MPELPEVETTRRGLAAARHRPRDRSRRGPRAATALARGQAACHARSPTARIDSLERRGKYLLFGTAAGTLLVHLGMSGSLRYLPAPAPPGTHDHIDVHFADGGALRFNDPRRFGSFMLTTAPSSPSVAQGSRPRAARRRVRRRLPVAHEPQPARRDQAARHERPSRRRCRQHLRERGVVPRGHPPAAHSRAESRERASSRW